MSLLIDEPEPSTNPHFLPLFPRGRFTLLIGDSGVGKSLLAAHLIARASISAEMPPDPIHYPQPPIDPPPPNPITGEVAPPPGVALWYAREDDDLTTSLRLSVALSGNSAFLPRVDVRHHGSLVPARPNRDNSSRNSEILAELPQLLDRAGRGVDMVILDPLPAYLENLDASHNAAMIRSALAPLLDFAYHHRTRVVGIAHTAKLRTRPARPLDYVAHSQAYAALARSILLLTTDTLTHDPLRRLLIPLKNSFALPDRAYGIRIHTAVPPDTDIPVAFLRFEDAPILNPFASPRPHTPAAPADVPLTQDQSELDEAMNLLKSTLAHGPQKSRDLLAEARDLGIPRTKFRTAKFLLNTKSTKLGKIWYTSLPDTPNGEDFSI